MIRNIILIIAALPLLAVAADAPSTKPSRHAIINMSLPNDPVALDAEQIQNLLYGRAAELAPELLGIPGDDARKWLSMGIGSGGRGLNSLDLYINLFDPKAKPNALALGEALAATVAKTYAETYDKERVATIAATEKAVADAEAAREKASSQYAQIRAEIRDLSDRSDTNSIAAAVNKLEEEHSTLELDLLAKTARREALENQLAEQAAKVEKRLGDDEIAVELQKVVEMREKMVERMKQLVSQNAASQAELSEAVGRVAEARAKVLERKRDAAMEAGGDALAALNREMMTLSIDLRELTARLKYIESRLPRLRDALDLTERLIEAQNNRSKSQSALERAQQHLQHEQQRFHEKPDVTIRERESSEKARDPQGNEVMY